MDGAWRQLVVQAVLHATNAAPPRLPIAAAGYETTANALAFAIYCLSTHPEAQARLLAEVDAFGSDKASGGGERGAGLDVMGLNRGNTSFHSQLAEVGAFGADTMGCPWHSHGGQQRCSGWLWLWLLRDAQLPLRGSGHARGAASAPTRPAE